MAPKAIGPGFLPPPWGPATGTPEYWREAAKELRATLDRASDAEDTGQGGDAGSGAS